MSLSDAGALDALQPFFEQGLISEIVNQLKSGKEATVYHCRGTRDSGHEFFAVKVYHERSMRSFRNDAIYLGGRMEYARNSRIRRAIESRSDFGRQVRHTLWIFDEWTTMRQLSEAGVDCPEPIAHSDTAILMSFIGDERGPAPQLRQVTVPQESVEPVMQSLLDNIVRMLDAQRVHGDLSPYNILLWDNRPVIIDFPQAIDPRLNHAAGELLRRDIATVCEWAHSRGVPIETDEVFIPLWNDFIHGRLG
jgi:RIO kinase 1